MKAAKGKTDMKLLQSAQYHLAAGFQEFHRLGERIFEQKRLIVGSEAAAAQARDDAAAAKDAREKAEAEAADLRQQVEDLKGMVSAKEADVAQVQLERDRAYAAAMKAEAEGLLRTRKKMHRAVTLASSSYELQLRASEDIFFQSGWLCALEACGRSHGDPGLPPMPPVAIADSIAGVSNDRLEEVRNEGDRIMAGVTADGPDGMDDELREEPAVDPAEGSGSSESVSTGSETESEDQPGTAEQQQQQQEQPEQQAGGP